MSSRKKVLHVLWDGRIGGLEEYVTTFTKYIDASQYKIYLCFVSGKGPIFDETLKGNQNVDFIGVKNGYDVLGALRFLRYLYRERFDIIHLHTRNYLTFLTVCLSPHTGKIISHHLSPGDSKVQKKASMFYKLFSGQLDRVIAISKVVRESLIADFHLDPNKIEVVYNSIDLDKYSLDRSVPEDMAHMKNTGTFTIGFIGRMADYKRPDLFVKIAVQLIQRSRNFQFLMVGDGPAFEKCERMISESGCAEYFSLLGFRRDIPDILKAFDAMLFTSVGEGFGIVLIEAMAMGVPVFAVNDGAVPEIIIHEKNGILLDSDDPEKIADQVVEIIDRKNLIIRVKNQCVKDVHDKFNIQQCAKQMVNIYERVLEKV